jgi:hypothetical protein
MAKTAGKAKAAVPAALQQRASALHAKAQARLAEQGREALARIREKRGDIAGSLVDIGEALQVLQGEGVAAALGREDFDEVCRVDLDMAPSTARRMIQVSQRFRRETVLSLGPDRAHALLELADAAPGEPSPEQLLEGTVTLPSGERMSVSKATAAQLHDAAKELRRAHKPSRRGLTASSDERKRFSEYAARLKAAGCEGAALKLVASRDEEGAWVELRVRLRDVDAAAAGLRRPRGR